MTELQVKRQGEILNFVFNIVCTVAKDTIPCGSPVWSERIEAWKKVGRTNVASFPFSCVCRGKGR